MAESMHEKWSMDKLKDSNWITWKFQMRHLLLSKGLWGHVDGSSSVADDASAQVKTEHEGKAQKAFSTIVMAIDASQLYLVTSCNNANEAWNELKNQFERKTLVCQTNCS